MYHVLPKKEPYFCQDGGSRGTVTSWGADTCLTLENGCECLEWVK